MTNTNIDKAIAILRRTNDGEDLSPQDLALLRHAAHGLPPDRKGKKPSTLYMIASWPEPIGHGCTE
jgi:hypothetical protein